MSQATLGSSPHQNSKLFSGYYLDERVDELDAWDWLSQFPKNENTREYARDSYR